MRRSALLLPLALSVACDRAIVLGDLPATASLGGAAGASTGGGGPASDGGASASAGASGALVFSSGFESGDFSDWGEQGSTLQLSGGTLSVVSDVAHDGSSSLSVTTEALDRYVELVLPAPYDQVLLGFWLRIDDDHDTYNWVIVNVDEEMPGGSIQQLFDLAINSPDAEQRFIIFEKPTLNGTEDGMQVAEASSSFGLGTWVHVELRLRAATDDTGELAVVQDGQTVIELAGRPTSTGGTLRLTLGSIASELDPLPAHFWLDDVTLHRL